MRSQLIKAIEAVVIATAALGTTFVTNDAHAQQAPVPQTIPPPSSNPMATPAPTLGRAAPVLSFDEAIHRAMDRNPTSEIAEQEVRRAQALVQQARSTWLPTLSGNATYTRLDADRVLADRVVTNANTFNANLLLTVPLIAPRAWVATARAKDNREIAKLSLVDARRIVALNAGRSYLTVIAQKRVLETAVQARDTARAHEEFSKARLAGGVGNRLDAVRAAQERASSETRVQNQTIALTRAQEALGVLLGENGPIDAVEASFGAPPTLSAALGEAERRSDVVASKERAESARKSVRDSYAEYLPLLTGTASPFYQNPASLTVPTTGWQAQLLLTIPIFDGGNRYGLKHERDALYDQAKTRIEAALRQARSEVRVAFEAVQRADDALAQARDAARLAQEALELSQLAYRAGATSNIEVIDAERQARDAATEAAIAEDTARQARLDLLSAAGRFP
ncbi:MAG: outer rane efflux protein [Labilithrix sp.]|nr:outer rane efflux protein [Labilithrix sp.]